MTKLVFWGVVGSFVGILVLLVLINFKLNRKFQIDSSWVALAVVPAIVWLFTTGQLASFSGFGLEFKLKAATSKPFEVELEGRTIEPEHVSSAAKAAPEPPRSLIEERVRSLKLQVGVKGYYSASAIEAYLRELTSHPFFRFVLFTDSEDKFRGLVSGIDLYDQIKEGRLKIVEVLEEDQLDSISGIVTSSIRGDASRKAALALMEEQQIPELPVVDSSGRFSGIVERDKIASSILLQLISQL